MNPRTLKRLAIALIVLVVAWAGLALAQHLGRDREGRIRLASFDPGVADGVLIRHRSDTLRFVRQGDGWLVNGNRANAGYVNDLLHALADTTAPSELAAKAASSLPQLGLDTADAWTVEALLGTRVLTALDVGNHGDGYSTIYVRKPGATTAYQLTQGQLADVTDRMADDWRDKTVAQVVPESVAVVQVRRGARAYTLTRGAKGWRLGAAPADSAAVASMLSQYRDVQATGFPTAAQADTARRARPSREVTLEAAGGRPLLVLQLDSTTGSYWVRRQGDSTLYQLDDYTVGLMTPADSTLRARPGKPAPPARAAAATTAGTKPARRRRPLPLGGKTGH